MALIAMHQALRRSSDQLAELDNSITRAGVIVQPTPYEQIRDYFHFNDNYVHELDLAAEALSTQLFDESATDRDQELMQYLLDTHGVSVGLDIPDSATIRTYDPNTQRLHLNRRHPSSTRAFQMAHQIALLEHGGTMDQLIEVASFGSDQANNICRRGLANYFAGALLMP
jgi:predicted transcriptional regulator